jgi:hypothetical protein
MVLLYLYEHIIRKIKMAVSINIPGIGIIDVQGVASESTLKEILTVLKNGGSGGSGSGGSGSGGSGSGGSGSSSNIAPVLSKNKLSLGLFSAKLLKAAEQLGDLGNSASSAATLFSQIPVLGEVFAVVARSADKMVAAYTTATDSGAAFGGSILSFSRSASDAGMQLEDFGRIIARNGVAMGAFGTTTEDGAKNFAKVSKTLRTTSNELYALGYSTSDINEGLASYGNLLRIQGGQGTRSNAQLALGAKSYLKEMDLLAKVTGEERAAKEKERESIAADGMFRAAMAGLGTEVEASFSTLIQAMPSKEMQDFAKDVIANGTATTSANQLVLSQMPELGAQLNALHQQTQSNVEISKTQMNQTMNLAKKEGTAALSTIKTAAAANSELHGLAAGLGSLNKINVDAFKESSAQQIEAAKNSDKFNKGMQEMQQALSSISNVFTAFLANTIFLDTMIIGVKLIGLILHEVLVPAFTATANFITRMLIPAFSSIAGYLSDYVYPAFLALAGFIVVDIMRPLQTFGNFIETNVIALLKEMSFSFTGFSTAIEYTSDIFSAVGSIITENLIPIMYGLSTVLTLVTARYIAQNVVGWASVAVQSALALATGITAAGMSILGAAVGLLTSPVTLLILGVAAVVIAIKKMYDNGWTLSSAFEALKDNLTRFGMTLSETMDDIRVNLGSWIGGISDEEAKQRKAERNQARAILDAREAVRDEERKKIADERSTNQDAKDRAEVGTKLNNVLVSQANKFGNALGITAENAEKDAKTINANAGSEGLLKQFVDKQGGRYANASNLPTKDDSNNVASKQAALKMAEANKQGTAEAKKQAMMADAEQEKKVARLKDEIAKAELERKKPAFADSNLPTPINTTLEQAEAKKQAMMAEAAQKKLALEQAEAKKKSTTIDNGNLNLLDSASSNDKESAKETDKKQQAASQLSVETLLSQLNSAMSQLIKLNQEQNEISKRQVSVTESLSNDLFIGISG